MGIAGNEDDVIHERECTGPRAPPPGDGIRVREAGVELGKEFSDKEVEKGWAEFAALGDATEYFLPGRSRYPGVQDSDINVLIGCLEESPKLPAKASRMRQQGQSVTVDRRESCFKIDKSTVSWGIVLSLIVEDCAHQGVNSIVSLTARSSKLVRRVGLGCPHVANDTAE